MTKQRLHPAITPPIALASRRTLLGAALTSLVAGACGRSSERIPQNTAASSSWLPRSPPPSLASPSPYGTRPSATSSPERCVVTEPNIEGPFFKTGAPHRAVLVGPDSPGMRLALSGRVLDPSCAPIAGAHIEIWQADHAGAYDNVGFGFRGALEADAQGNFHVDTIIPGRYLNGSRFRPAHLHLKVTANDHRLTTQLYFEGDPYNVGDPFIRQSLVMALSDTTVGKAARHDIVLG